MSFERQEQRELVQETMDLMKSLMGGSTEYRPDDAVYEKPKNITKNQHEDLEEVYHCLERMLSYLR
mgnify:CR=1 FL=1